IFDRVDTSRSTLDSWWNLRLYEQSPRSVLAPNMFGEFIVTPPLTTNIVSPVTGRPGSLSNPTGGNLVGRTTVAYDNSPLPRDRLIANFDFIDNAPLRAVGHDINRFTLGFEKTFFDSQASVSLQVPFAAGTLNTVATEGQITGLDSQSGNLFLTLKALL